MTAMQKNMEERECDTEWGYDEQADQPKQDAVWFEKSQTQTL